MYLKKTILLCFLISCFFFCAQSCSNFVITEGDTGFHSCSYFTNITISNTISWTNLSFILSNATYINGYLIIQNNSKLSDLSVFSLLTFIEGPLIIDNNPSLTDLSAFSRVRQIKSSFIGDLQIINNPSISNVNGFQNLTLVAGNLIINNNSKLNSIDQFTSLNSIGVNISINNNSLLQKLQVLSFYNEINNLTISGNNLICKLIPSNWTNKVECCGNDKLSPINHERCDNKTCNQYCTDCLTGYFTSRCIPCTCLNGACYSGVSGSGKCQSCYPNYFGDFCEYYLSLVTNGTVFNDSLIVNNNSVVLYGIVYVTGSFSVIDGLLNLTYSDLSIQSDLVLANAS